MVAGGRIATKIRKSIFSATNNLKKHPLMGSLEVNLLDLQQDNRYLVKGKYKIIYRISNNVIYIIDVFDSRRDPSLMKERDSLQ